MALRQFDAAIAAFEQVPNDSVLRDYADIQVAVSLEQLDKDNDAVARLNALIARNPKSSDAYITLGSYYRRNNKDAEAVDAYTKALDLMAENRPNTWRVIYERASSLDRLKKYDQAEADFRKALKLSHDDPEVLNYLGYSMIDRGVNLDEALAMVKKAVNLKPNDGYITDSLGWAYYTMRNYADATSWCEHAVDLKPSDPILNEHLGDVYWRVGRELEARFQWQHALDDHPDDADIPRIQAKLKDGLPPDTGAVKPNNG
jgi:Flp pilus assembly protein TadD